MKNISDLFRGDLGTIGRLAERGAKFVDRIQRERDIYRDALRQIRDGLTNDARALADEALREGERL